MKFRSKLIIAWNIEPKYVEIMISTDGWLWHFLLRLTWTSFQKPWTQFTIRGTIKYILFNCKTIMILNYSLHIVTMRNIEQKYIGRTVPLLKPLQSPHSYLGAVDHHPHTSPPTDIPPTPPTPPPSHPSPQPQPHPPQPPPPPPPPAGPGGGVKSCIGAWKLGPESPVGVISLWRGIYIFNMWFKL